MNSIGFINRGNSCYFNAALQLIGLIDGLQDYIRSGKWDEDWNDIVFKHSKNPQKLEICKIIKWWSLLQVRMHTNQEQKTIVDPSILRVWMATREAIWIQSHQQDSQEALGLFIDLFCEWMGMPIEMDLEIQNDTNEMKAWNSWNHHYGKSYSIWTELLFGQIHETVYCTNCNHQTNQFDPFLFLFLNVDSITSWKQPFQDYFREKDGHPDYRCDQCGKQKCSRQKTECWRLPYYLLTVWKSFTGNCVEPQIVLPKKDELLEINNCSYRLFGFINHIGNLKGGHYCMIRMPSPEWGPDMIQYDDVNIRVITENDITGRVYIGLWKQINETIQESDFWKSS